MKIDKWLHDGDFRTQILKRGFVAGWYAYRSRENQKLEWHVQRWEGDAKMAEPTFEAKWNEADFVEITDEIKSNFDRFLDFRVSETQGPKCQYSFKDDLLSQIVAMTDEDVNRELKALGINPEQLIERKAEQDDNEFTCRRLGQDNTESMGT